MRPDRTRRRVAFLFPSLSLPNRAREPDPPAPRGGSRPAGRVRGVPANEQARRPRRVRRRKRRGSSPSPPSPRRVSGREGASPRHAGRTARGSRRPCPGPDRGGIKSRRLQILRRHGSAFSPVRASRELRTGPANHWALWGPSRGVQVQAPSTIKAGRALCIAVAYGGDHPTTADGSGWLQLNW